jgi:hypothetical protein
MRKRKGPIGTAVFVMIAIIAGMYWIAQQYGLWLPDLVLPRRTLAEDQTADGHRFQVVQFVGDVEWYTTELVHTFPSGKSETHLLAFEDDFTWRCPMSVSATERTVLVTTGQGLREVRW